MTILGKILVFVNLVLCLATSWFIAMTFTKDNNWKISADNWKSQAQAVVDDFQVYKSTRDQQVKEKDAQLTKLQQQLDGSKGEHENLTKQIQLRSQEVEKLQALNQQMKANADSTLADMARMKDERAQMQAALDKRNADVIGLQKQMQTVRDDAVAKEIAYRMERQLNDKLRTENEQITQENNRLKTTTNTVASNGGAAPVTTLVAKPPPEDVDGTVTDTDTREGLVTLSIGSDSGLARGQTMEVYRFKPKPQYVGMVRILDARLHESVARAVQPLLAGPIRKGDQVSARIGIHKD